MNERQYHPDAQEHKLLLENQKNGWGDVIAQSDWQGKNHDPEVDSLKVVEKQTEELS